NPVAEARVLLDHTTAPRAHDGREPGRMDPDLLEPVAVQVHALDGERRAAPQLALGQRELVPDGMSQMRQVQAYEHAVPLRVVALRAADRPARRRRLARAPAQRRP